MLTMLVTPGGGAVVVAWRGERDPEERRIALPEGFAPGGWHLVRVEVDGARARLALDGVERWAGRLGAPAERLALLAGGVATAFSGFALTVGWEDLFEEDGDPAALGWEATAGEWTVRDGELVGRGAPAVIAKGPLLDAYELVVNARLIEPAGDYGFYPALAATGPGPLLTLERAGQGWALVLRDAGAPRSFSLPDAFDPDAHQHFRCRKQADGRLTIHLEAHLLADLSLAPTPTRVGLAVRRGAAGFEMVRVTAVAGA